MPPEASKQPGISIDGMFLQSARFSHADGFLDLPVDTKFTGSVQIQASNALRGDEKAARITLTVSVNEPEKQPYSFEIAVVVQVSAIEGQENLRIRDFVAAPAAISLVYPFLRQAVADITLKGRFGPVWLNMVNPQLLVPAVPTSAKVPEASAEPTRKG